MALIKNFDKIIHQVWWQGVESLKKQPPSLKDQNSILDPTTLCHCQQSYTNFCNSSDWSYHFWDEDSATDLVKQEFPQYYDYFQQLPTIIAKCDCIRPMIMYIYGGLYADLDSYLIKNLNDFLEINTIHDIYYRGHEQYGISEEIHIQQDYRAIFAQEPFIFEYYHHLYGLSINKISNAIMFSGKKYEFWLEFLAAGFSRKRNLSNPLDSFGPNSLSLQVMQTSINTIKDLLKNHQINQNKGPDMCQGASAKMLLMPPQYLQCLTTIDDENQYIVHKFDGRWM